MSADRGADLVCKAIGMSQKGASGLCLIIDALEKTIVAAARSL